MMFVRWVVRVHDAGISAGGVDVTGPLACYVRTKQAPLTVRVINLVELIVNPG